MARRDLFSYIREKKALLIFDSYAVYFSEEVGMFLDTHPYQRVQTPEGKKKIGNPFHVYEAVENL